MNYLFFDIECASVYKTTAKICAFGYCLTDEKFNIIKHEDMLINPRGGFHLTDRKGEQGLILPYAYDDFKTYPTFPERAKEIYALLEDENTLVLGHAVMNDVKYLNLETHRYSLPSFRFSFADTQFIYMNKVGDFSRQFGLGTIAERLGVSFTAHRAKDDAYATMKVAEAMCKEENCTLFDLLKKYEITLGKIENYEISPFTSKGATDYAALQAKKREEKDKAHAIFHAYVEKAKKKRKKEGKLKGKSISFARGVAHDKRIYSIIDKMFEEGGFFCYRVETCNTYVKTENETGGRLMKAVDKNATIITLDELEKMLF